MFASDANSFSFVKLQGHPKPQQENVSTIPQVAEGPLKGNSSKFDEGSIDILLEQIDSSTNVLKQKTIALVQVLRKHSLNHSLEGQLQNYLTEVLDHMDVLLLKKSSCLGSEMNCLIQKEGHSFCQVNKPLGDVENIQGEDTYRQHLRSIEEASNESTQKELNSRLTSILKEIQLENEAVRPVKYEKVSRQIPANDEKQKSNLENRFKMQQKHHKFSNSYIRDVTKVKKAKHL